MVSLVIFSAGAVSAEDNATYSDENYELNTVALDDGVADTSQENTSEIVKETADTQQIGNFSKLQNAIAQGGDIYMNNSYYNFTATITITKNCNIYGGTSSNPQGGEMATCDGQNARQLFTISGNIAVNFHYINMINGNASDGGAIYRKSGSVTTGNCTFTNNTATNRGGAIYTESGSVTTGNCTFTNNTATNRGGAICTENGAVTATNCTFTNNTAAAGGTIYSYNSGSVTVTNCTFTNNTAKSSGGGAIFCHNAPVTATNCTFTNNKATQHGGAINNNRNSVTANNCTFTNNTATGSSTNNGGAINSGGSVTATNCTFTNNTATNSGAIQANGAVTATNCTFTNNKANNGNGAAINNGGSVTATNCTFTNNTATGSGAIFSYGAVTANNCTFTNNKANNGNGGAINNKNGAVTANNCTFTNNTATGSSTNNGGAINSGGSVTVENCTFTNNTSNYGGAINSGGSVTANNCTFTNNKAEGSSIPNGGGAISSGNPVTAENCTFTNNNANQNGGAIYSANSVTANNCNFTNNKAAGPYSTNGGGAIFSVGSVSTNNCNFTGNTANQISCGGAIHSKSGYVTAENCNFTNNIATRNGGAIYSNDSVKMTNCDFVNNTGKSGYSAIYCGNGVITSCFFEGNQVRSGNRIVVGKVSNANVLDSNIVELSTNSQTWRDVKKVFCNMTLDVKVDSDSASIVVDVPNNATGTITFNIKGENSTFNSNKTINIVDGKAVWNLSDLEFGKYNVLATYNGNAFYYSTSTNGTFIIKKSTNIKYTLNNSIIQVEVLNGTGNITIKIDNDVYVVEPIVDGKVEIVLPDNLTPGDHNLTVIYSGDDYYEPVAVNTTFIVKDNITDVIDVKVENNTLIVSVPKNTTGNMTIKIDDGEDVVKPIVEGKVEIPLGNLTSGDHNLTIIYNGDDYYNPAEINTTFIVKDNVTMVITVENEIITVILPENATGSVTLIVDGMTPMLIPHVPSDYELVNGTVKVPFEGLEPGLHNVTAIYNGDDYYNPTEANTTFIVKDNVTMTITVENNTITVTLPENATGNVTIKVDDGEDIVKPIVEGKVEVALPDDLKPGDHNVTAEYVGDDYYNPTEANTTFIVKDNVTMVITVENETITVTLPENATGSVTLIVDGMTPMLLPHVPSDYELVNGTVKVPFEGLEPGLHNVTAIYNGNDYYNPTEANTTFMVKDNVTMVITVENETITVTLPVNATGNVTIKVDDGEDVVRPIVDGKVEVALPDDLKPGDHNITTEYDGDDYYNPAEANTTFIVKDNITGLIDVKVENNTIFVSVPENATGNVTIKIDDNEYVVRPIVNGKVEVALPSDLKPGNHNLTVIYNGDDYYNPAEANTTFVVKDNTIDVIDNNESTVEQNTTMLPKNEATTSTLETGNPIALLILSICLLIPLRRLRK